MPSHYDSEEFTKAQAVKLKGVNKATSESKNRRTFVLKKDKRGNWYQHFTDKLGPLRGNISNKVGEKMAQAKKAKMPGTSHYTVDWVPMKNVKDPEKVPKGEDREKIVAENKKKSILSPASSQTKNVQEASAQARKNRTSGRIKDSNTKAPVRTSKVARIVKRLRNPLAIAIAGGAMLAGGKGDTTDKPPVKPAPKPKKKPAPKKRVPSKDTNKRVDSKKAIQARMKADRDSSPVDYEGDYPIYRKDSAPAKSFRKKYREEKDAGAKTFTWQGRKYNTK